MKTSSEQRIAYYTEKGWWTEHTLHGQLHLWVGETPGALAVADQPNRSELDGLTQKRLTFEKLDSASTNLAAQLLANGIRENDVIVVQLPNVSELLVLYYAVSKIGAIVSPVPMQYGEHELNHVVAQVSPAAFVTVKQFKGEELDSAKQFIREAKSSIKLLFFDEQNQETIERLSLNSETVATHVSRLEEHQGTYKDDPHKIVTICWTSGTTGTPKGVPRSHAMWFATARSCAEASSFQKGERLLNPFPAVNMAALGGFLYPAALHGCAIFLHHPIDVPVFLNQIQQEQINFTIAPPPLLNQLARSADMWNQFDFSSLRAVGSGSAPLSPTMIDVFEHQYEKPVINFYGSNEGISLYSTPTVAKEPEIRASMFPRLGSGAGEWSDMATANILTKVVDTETGVEIREPGQVGELLISGATVFDGYLHTVNDDVFDDDGYFRTGDLVEICGDPPDYYRIAGRCKDIINRGGMKISPSDIDVLLEGLNSCSEAAVCAFADDRLGEKICACLVVADERSKPTLDQVNEFLLDKGLAKFKLPERLEFFDVLPRNPLGKVQRFVLQEAVAERMS